MRPITSSCGWSGIFPYDRQQLCKWLETAYKDEMTKPFTKLSKICSLVWELRLAFQFHPPGKKIFCFQEAEEGSLEQIQFMQPGSEYPQIQFYCSPGLLGIVWILVTHIWFLIKRSANLIFSGLPWALRKPNNKGHCLALNRPLLLLGEPCLFWWESKIPLSILFLLCFQRLFHSTYLQVQMCADLCVCQHHLPTVLLSCPFLVVLRKVLVER